MARFQPISQADFLKRAAIIHGDKYDYSQTVYVRLRDKVTIICPTHGEFEQMPVVHLFVKGGCQHCGRERTTAARHAGLTGFLKKARKAHGESYDYSKVIYLTCKDKVTIICPTHGEFEQMPDKHVQGKGCGKCGNTLLLTQEEFIAKAKAAHGERYDYSRAVYRGGHKKLIIICSIHGEFKQEPVVHYGKDKCGCPGCKKDYLSVIFKQSWIEQANSRVSVLYFIRFYSDTEQFFKVGITLNSVAKRYSGNFSSGYKYEILAEYKSKNAAAVYEWEQSILETFAHLRYKPKRKFQGATECFSSAEEILAIFPL